MKSERLEEILVDFNQDKNQENYPIFISKNLLTDCSLFNFHFQKTSKILIVTNTKVGPLYLPVLKQTLSSLQKEVHEIVLPDGEEFKDIFSCMKIINKALEIPLDRKSFMVALGGGVVGDVTGFAASIYQRGIPFVQVPTSLMAMVDSSIGGKTAVNHPLGKNLIGSFFQPKAVFIDLDTLSSLSDREYLSGIAETIKYGLIQDFSFFEWIEDNTEALLARDPEALRLLIRRSCENKAKIVSADEREERGERALLNLGHTFGHAIETGFGYGLWLHGEAVAAGVVMAADLSRRLDWIDEQLPLRLKRLLLAFSLPVDLNNVQAKRAVGEAVFDERRRRLTTQSFCKSLSLDKKVSNGRLHLVLLQSQSQSRSEPEAKPGCHSVLTDDYSEEKLQETISYFLENREKEKEPDNE